MPLYEQNEQGIWVDKKLKKGDLVCVIVKDVGFNPQEMGIVLNIDHQRKVVDDIVIAELLLVEVYWQREEEKREATSGSLLHIFRDSKGNKTFRRVNSDGTLGNRIRSTRSDQEG